MDQFQRLNSEITKLKADYQSEVDRQTAQCYSLIKVANEDLRVKSERIIAVKGTLLKQKIDFERDYRERVQHLITESQIVSNLSLIPKVITKEIDISELPSYLHPLVDIYVRIQECNQEGQEAQREFKVIYSEQTTKLENIIPTLKPAYEARLIELLKQLREEIRLYNSQIESEITSLEPKPSKYLCSHSKV